jgi:hypothetical protein
LEFSIILIHAMLGRTRVTRVTVPGVTSFFSDEHNIIGFTTIFDAFSGSSLIRVGIGVCYPISRVSPKVANPSPLRVADWTWTRNSDDQKFRTSDFRDAVHDPAKVEPVVVEAGPPIAGQANFKRWRFLVHPGVGSRPHLIQDDVSFLVGVIFVRIEILRILTEASPQGG